MKMPINAALIVKISNRCIYSIQDASDLDFRYEVYRELTMVRNSIFFLENSFYTAIEQALENVK